MHMFTWWRIKKKNKIELLSISEMEKDVCPECGGEGCIINENHYIADNDYERRYLTCKRCYGTGFVIGI